jgi:Tol biopolymer transport system component
LYWISPNEFIFESSQYGESQIWGMNIDTKKTRQLTTMGASIFLYFNDVISPNKRRILFRSNDDSIWELDIVSGKERCILFRKPNEEIAEMCQYSGNGKELFFVLKNKIYRINIATGEKHLMVKDGRIIDLNAKTMQAIIEKDSKTYFVDLNKPDNPKFLPTTGGSLSPNGDKIVFSKINNEGSEELWIMNINTLKKIQITQGSMKNYFRKTYFLSWSPDGSKIIYSFEFINKEYFGKVKKRLFVL